MALEWAVSVTIKITSPSDSVAQALEEAEALFLRRSSHEDRIADEVRNKDDTTPTVGMDITPLLGTLPSGIAMFVREVIQELCDITSVEGYSLTYSQRSRWPTDVPENVSRPAQWRRVFPAKLAIRLWERISVPSGRLWTWPANAIHGTNYLLPPTCGKCTGVVTGRRLTHLHVPTSGSYRTLKLLKRSADKGALFHVPTEAVKADLIRSSRLEESRV